jgi:hypothetical protein
MLGVEIAPSYCGTVFAEVVMVMMMKMKMKIISENSFAPLWITIITLFFNVRR